MPEPKTITVGNESGTVMAELHRLLAEVSALRTAGDRLHHWLAKTPQMFSEGHPWRLMIESVMKEWEALRTGGDEA